jgi:hypothetical protein
VRAREAYVFRQSNGKKHLQYTIAEKPTPEKRYYWVKVLEDNGEMYFPQFSMRVYPKNWAITYLNPATDSVMVRPAKKKGKR